KRALIQSTGGLLPTSHAKGSRQTPESSKRSAHLTLMKVSQLADVRLLDNPVWYALTTEQAYLAEGNSLAKRFPRDVAPFAAMRNQSAAEYQALEEVLSGDAAALALDSPPALPSAWTMQHSGEMYQMI